MAKQATVYEVDRIIRVSPNNGTDFTMEELQHIVGGTFDIQKLPGTGEIMVLNDNGVLDGLPVNIAATAIWRKAYPIAEYPINNGQLVVGTVIVCDADMVR